MKYNRSFIAAVHATAESFGDVAAEAVFNKLFDNAAQAFDTYTSPKSPAELYNELNRKVDGYVYMNDVRIVNCRIGKPFEGCSFAVSWIKEFRDVAQSGLKFSKDVYDFVRDNPTVLDYD